MSSNTSPDISEYHQIGDYVVPSYTDHGTKLKEGIIVGTENDLVKAAERISHSALARGSMLPAVEPASVRNTVRKGKKKIGVKDKSPTPVYIQPINQNTTQENLRVIMPTVSVSMPQARSVMASATESYKPIDIVFHNKFGKITLSIESYIETDFAICLVFNTEKELRFIPEQAEELELALEKDKVHKVLSPGIVFTWLDGKRKLMVLIKIPNEDTTGID